MLATSYGDTIKILDTSNDFTEITSIKLDTGIICSMSYSPDNKILAITGTNRIYIVKDNVYVKTLDNINNCSKIICFSPDSKYLASESNDNSIIICDCDDNFNEFLNVTIDGCSILELQFSIDGNFLIVESNDTIFFLNKINNFSIVEELTIYNATNTTISPCGKFLMYTSIERITILDCHCNFNILKHIDIESSIEIMDFSSDGKFLALAYFADIVILDCNNDFIEISNIYNDTNVKISCFSSINNDKMYLAVNYHNNNIIKIFDCYDNFNQIYTLESISTNNLILFSPITSCGDNFLIAINVENSKSIEVWDCNNAFVKSKILTNITDGTVCFENDIKSTVLW